MKCASRYVVRAVLGAALLSCAITASAPSCAWASQTQSETSQRSAQEGSVYKLADVNEDGDTFSKQYYLNGWNSLFKTDVGANVKAAWTQIKCSHSVSVAVLDTGVLASHEDLSANIDTEHAYDVVLDAKGSALTDVGQHGTHVAGIIAATAGNKIGIAGVSYNAKIIPINVFNTTVSTASDGSVRTESTTSSELLIKAYNYLDGLIESGALKDLHVINLSLGTYEQSEKDEELRAAIKEMREKHNVVTVCAGGNGDSCGRAYTQISYPADFDECVSVTALNENGTNIDWSDYNKYKDISAPGRRIWSTYARSNNDYCTKSGTSMAAPVVSGAFALLWALDPKLTVDQAVKAIKATARPVNTASSDRRGYTGSAGALDTGAAVTYVQQHYLKAGKASKLQIQKKGKRWAKVTWAAATGATSYQIRYKTGKGTWKTKASKKVSVKLSKLKSGKKYKVQVRAKNAAGWGAWSKAKTFKTKR